MTPQEAALAMGVLPQQVQRQTKNAIRRGLSYWRKLELLGVTMRGIGKAIWGGNKLTTLRAIVKRAGNVEYSGGSYSGGLKLTGIASLMETGGKTLPHVIKPVNAPRLAFMANGRLAMPLSVQHPGSRVPATPSAAPVVGEVGLYTTQQVEIGMTKAIAEAGLSG